MYKLPRRFPLLPRKKNTSKADFGHVFILSGSKQYRGAPLLTAKGALFSGCGLLTAAVPENLKDLVSGNLPEAILFPLRESKMGSSASSNFSKIADYLKKRQISAVAIGTGLSIFPDTSKLVRLLINSIQIPVVLDADGLNSFDGHADLLRKHKGPLVITPHDKEFQRLFGQSVPRRESEKMALAKKISKEYQLVLVLKGHRSLVIEGDRVYINLSGNPAMAKGGTGDVLAGIISSFIAQGLDLFQAAVWGVYFHGKAGDKAAKKKGELSVLASDLIRHLPQALKNHP
jgi:ADP-dependent NAD(P)H-hydrate dehydratase / NAD(P)H-hydrate epimerase